MLTELTGGNQAVTTRWFQPREWRMHLLADEPYWVEHEVLVLRGDLLVEQLSWSVPLGHGARAVYDQALTLTASLGMPRS